MNVFEHQRFRLRTPTGERVSKSFRELVTESDAPYALDYAQAFYDVAALNLLSYLAQVAFEPQTAAKLAERIAAPMSEAEFEEGVGPLRARFALTGDGPRFMQAAAPIGEVKTAEPLDVAVFVAPKGDRQFLFRSDAEWAVAPEQAGLFLFARNTFYEGTGGRGYQKGTNGDTPVRVVVTDPAEGDALWLRRTLWLNVLARDAQRTFAGAYADPQALGPGDYDGLFWTDPPPPPTIPVGAITLRAGLGWISAFHWLWFEDGEGVCPLTGERITGLVARRASKRSTGISYGAKGDLDAGVRADRLFRHPNVPTENQFKDGDKTGERPFLVQRTEGLARAVGAAFFGGRSDRRNARYTLAPAVGQLIADPVQALGLNVRLRVFGFHMLSAQKNVHGGIEESTFAFRPPAADTPEGLQVLDLGAELMGRATDFATEAARALGQAVQRTSGAGVRAKETEDGQIQLQKLEPVPSVDDPFGRDVLAAFWRDAGGRLAGHAGRVAEAGAGGPASLAAQETALQAAWEAETVRVAYRLFEPVFDHYSTLPRTMPYAHAARRLLAGTLKKIRSTVPDVAPQPETA